MRQFALLPSMSFLCLLSLPPKIHTSGTLELTKEDSNWFNTLEDGVANFQAAMKMSRKRQKAAEEEDE